MTYVHVCFRLSTQNLFTGQEILREREEVINGIHSCSYTDTVATPTVGMEGWREDGLKGRRDGGKEGWKGEEGPLFNSKEQLRRIPAPIGPNPAPSLELIGWLVD